MPNLQRVFPGRKIFQNKLSVLIRSCEVWGFGNDDISGHLRVHITEHRPDTGFVEEVVLRRFLRISSQVEPRRTWRENVVPDFITIRKRDGCAGEDCYNVRHKGQVDLV